MKKAKFIPGLCLIGHSLLFFILTLKSWNSSKNTSRTLAVFSAVEGAAGACMVMNELAKQESNEEDDASDELFADDDALACDDISVSFTPDPF